MHTEVTVTLLHTASFSQHRTFTERGTYTIVMWSQHVIICRTMSVSCFSDVTSQIIYIFAIKA